ncbi:MAG: hypothetical protein IT423_18170, partial [Pirellulaceae bacterium]|nr:hypothetical protein [Pirellulaceae bacterium]
MPPTRTIQPAKPWTRNDEGKSGKWVFVFWLSLALVVMLGWFIWHINPPESPRVFYTSIAVEDYGQ